MRIATSTVLAVLDSDQLSWHGFGNLPADNTVEFFLREYVHAEALTFDTHPKPRAPVPRFG